MGSCLSSASPEDRAAAKASKNIEKLMNNALIMESEKVKLLLLGAGESGKSTIFKQMRVLFGAPLSEEEKQQITPVVYNNTITSMKLLLQAVSDMDYGGNVSDYCSCHRIRAISLDIFLTIFHLLVYVFRLLLKIKIISIS